MVQQSLTSDSGASNDIVSALALLEPFRDKSKTLAHVKGPVYRIHEVLPTIPIEDLTRSIPTSPKMINFNLITVYDGSSPNVLSVPMKINISRTNPNLRLLTINDAIAKVYQEIHLRSNRGNLFGFVRGNALPTILGQDYSIRSINAVYCRSSVESDGVRLDTHITLTKIDQGTLLDSVMHIKPSKVSDYHPLVRWLASSVSDKLPSNQHYTN